MAAMLVQGVTGRSRLSQSHAWVFGNEAKGLSGADMRACDSLVSIPMTGDAESLNVASAAATCLFASQDVYKRQPQGRVGRTVRVDKGREVAQLLGACLLYTS